MPHGFQQLNMDGAICLYDPTFFKPNHQLWYDLINDSVQWNQFEIQLYGKKILQPRHSFYMANENLSYKYSGVNRLPDKWTVAPEEMKNTINNTLKQINKNHPEINAVLGNKYDDGRHYIGAHSDDEKDLNQNSFIASVSLGAPRDFIFTHKKTKQKITILLEPGSLLLMGGDCQKNWNHELPKRLKINEPRINLTFRSINIKN